MWIPIDINFSSHPKTRKLARILEIPIPAAIGHMIALWTWAANYAKSGTLEKYDNEEIADAALIPATASADQFVDALIQARFLYEDEGVLVFSGWNKYTGKTIQKMASAAERKRKARARKKAEEEDQIETSEECPQDGTGTSAGQDADIQGTSSDKIRKDKIREDKKEKKTPKRPPAAFYTHVQTSFNEILPELDPVFRIEEGRKKKLDARWREKKEHRDLNFWIDYWKLVKSSEFLTGKKGDWIADFDWLILPSNMKKVLSKNYHRNGQKGCNIYKEASEQDPGDLLDGIRAMWSAGQEPEKIITVEVK